MEIYADFIIMFVESLLILTLFDTFSNTNRIKKVELSVISLFYSFFMLFLNKNTYFIHLASFVPIIYLSAYGLIKKKMSIKLSVLFSLLIIANVMLINLFFLLLASLTTISAHNLIQGDSNFLNYIVLILSKLFLLLEIMYVSATGSDKYIFDKNIWKTVICISLVTIFVMFLVAFQYLVNGMSFFACILIFVMMIITNFLVFSLCFYITNTNIENTKNKLLLESYKHKEQQVQLLNEKAKQHAKFMHDHYKHLSAIRYLSKNTLNNEAIEKYIDDITIKDDIYTITTNNEILNYILTSKLNEAKSRGIESKYLINGTYTDYIKDADYSVILSNLLDNGIEAASQTELKYISIDLDFSDEWKTEFKITNSSLPVKTDRFGKLKTTKTDSKQHGIGMMSIHDTVSKYNGDDEFKYEDGMFTHICILYNKDFIN